MLLFRQMCSFMLLFDLLHTIKFCICIYKFKVMQKSMIQTGIFQKFLQPWWKYYSAFVNFG
jgi:hypothetical protein